MSRTFDPREQHLDRALLVDLVNVAIQAPSSHNTQPWLFRPRRDCVELWADRTRALPVNDPRDRELTISCGAALLNFRVAAAARDLRAQAELVPDVQSPDLLARIRVADASDRDELARLRPAVEARYTTREAFDEVELPSALAEELSAAAAAEGARLHVVDSAAREQIASLVAEGDRAQFGDRAWRRELASWMHPRRSGDGLATSPLIAPISRLVVRHVDMGERIGDDDEALALQAPLLAILTTGGDAVADWLRAGQALQRALLVGAASGVQAGYLNQPCQVEALRRRLAESITPGEFPQLIVRLGVLLATARTSARRSAADVIDDEPRADVLRPSL